MSTWIKTSTQKPTAANLPIEVWDTRDNIGRIISFMIQVHPDYSHWREYRPEPPPTEPVVKTRDDNDQHDYCSFRACPDGITSVHKSYHQGRNDERKKIREIFGGVSLSMVQGLLNRHFIVSDSIRRLAEEIAEEGT